MTVKNQLRDQTNAKAKNKKKTGRPSRTMAKEEDDDDDDNDDVTDEEKRIKILLRQHNQVSGYRRRKLLCFTFSSCLISPDPSTTNYYINRRF